MGRSPEAGDSALAAAQAIPCSPTWGATKPCPHFGLAFLSSSGALDRDSPTGVPSNLQLVPRLALAQLAQASRTPPTSRNVPPGPVLPSGLWWAQRGGSRTSPSECPGLEGREAPGAWVAVARWRCPPVQQPQLSTYECPTGSPGAVPGAAAAAPSRTITPTFQAPQPSPAGLFPLSCPTPAIPQALGLSSAFPIAELGGEWACPGHPPDLWGPWL